MAQVAESLLCRTQSRGIGHGTRGIVENHPVGADVVVLELVVGQAAAIRRGDVHHRHAIARLADRGARRADHDAFGLGQQAWLLRPGPEGGGREQQESGEEQSFHMHHGITTTGNVAVTAGKPAQPRSPGRRRRTVCPNCRAASRAAATTPS